MIIRRILTIGLAVHFCLGTAVNSKEGSTSHPPEPSLSIRLSFSAKERFPLRSLKLSIDGPDGKTTWRYAAEGRAETEPLMEKRTVSADNWYAAPGKYSLRVSYCLAGRNSDVRTEAQEFLAEGQELAITAALWFIDDPEKQQTFLADLTIRRFHAGSNSVWLIQDWIPAPKDQPRYQIVNDMNQPIYGVGWQGNFFGHVQREVRGQWINYPRGGFCGTVAGAEPLEPNQSVGSIEGYFIGGANPFAAGRYRYVVQYCIDPTAEGVPMDLTDKGLTRTRVQEIYEVSTEFYVESNERNRP